MIGSPDLRRRRARAFSPSKDRPVDTALCTLKVLASTDLHMNLLPYDYFADQADPTVGIMGVARRVAAIRALNDNTLLLDNGDLLQGTPMADLFLQEGLGDPGELPHPAIVAMNAMGYDGATLGNHDFNYGIAPMLSAYADADFPILSTNLDLEPLTGPEGPIAKTAVLDRMLRDQHGALHPIRIGLVGLLPPETQEWERRYFRGRGRITPMAEAAARATRVLREPGSHGAPCDLVIALAHTGIASQVRGGESAALALAQIDGLDAVVCGHTHRVFPSPGFLHSTGIDPVQGTLNGKPAVLAGERGSHLGVISLELRPFQGGGWSVERHSSRAEQVNDPQGRATTPQGEALAAKLERILAPYHRATLKHIRRAVGHTNAPLNSFFSLVRPDPALALIAEAKRTYLRTCTDVVDLPLLAAVTPFRAGGRSGPGHYTDVASGALTTRSIADLYLYPDQVHAIRLTGLEVLEWLERSASVFRRITPGQSDQVLLDPDFPAYRFDVIDGVDYEIDLSQPQRYDAAGQLHNPLAHRIRNLSREGFTVAPDDSFLMAVSSYRLSTASITPERIVHQGTDCARQILTRYVAEAGELSPRAANHWRFAPTPHTSVLFDTSPDAHAHLETVGLCIEPAGDGPNGFARFRIYL